MKSILGLSALALAVLLPALPAEPCCMVPRDYKGTISQSAQEAALFWHDGKQDLILKINYKITGAAMPDRFAWIITVPNEPEAYATADPKFFEELFAWADPLLHPPARGTKGEPAPGADRADLEFGKRVQVGPYDIQPVRALGKEALAGLNDWLGKNGFPTEDPDHMAYFVEKKFTFLCVKVSPPAGEKTVAPAAGLPPLHLTFRTPQPYYPLRFSSRQGVFDVNLYVFTRTPFDYAASGDSLRRINWKDARTLKDVEVDVSSFPKLLKEARARGAFKDLGGAWRLNVLRGSQVNKDNAISTWTEDIFFKTRG